MIEQTALASLLEARLIEWDKARKSQELKLLDCYQDVMRIPREEDTAGTGTAKVKKAKSLFMGSTRNKVRSARAKITDALFGNGEYPFDTTPTDEKLAQYADVTEDIITDQLDRMGFRGMLKSGVNTLGTYGTGFIFGPFVRTECHTETSAEDAGGTTAIKEEKYEFDCPYFELGNTLDVFPDPEARRIEDGLGTFWVTMMSPHTVEAWKKKPGYKNVADALLSKENNGDETGSQRAEQYRGNIQYWHKNDRIKVARYFGKIPKHSLSVWNAGDDVHDETKDTENAELIDAIVIMAGGVVIKVDESPWTTEGPVHRCVYEEVEHEIWGVGLAENNAPHQKVTNAAFRLFMEGKGMALLGTATVDRSKFLQTEDFKKFPGKVYQTKPGLSPEERKEAIIHHTEPDITGGWLEVIKMSEQFSDDDTAVNKYTQGNDSSNLNKTAHGISMIMSAASLPLKEVISNVDEMWIVPMIKALIDWNLKFLDPETVAKIHGPEEAKLWAEIKQFGKSSFMSWKATGTSSFMQKEILVGKIKAFSEFALANPVTAPLIDARELLNQTWNAMEVGKESPILKEDGDQEIPPQARQQMQELSMAKDQLEHALQQAHTEHTDLENQVKARADVTAASDKAQNERERMKHIRDIEFEKVKATQAADDNAHKLELAKISSDQAWQIAVLNAKVQLAIAGVKQDMAAQALASEHVLEGMKIDASKEMSDSKMAVDMHKHETGLDAQSQSQDKQLQAAEKVAKAKPEPAKKK